MKGPDSAILTVDEAMSMLPASPMIQVATATEFGWSRAILPRHLVEGIVQSATGREHAWDEAARNGMALILWNGPTCQMVASNPLWDWFAVECETGPKLTDTFTYTLPAKDEQDALRIVRPIAGPGVLRLSVWREGAPWETPCSRERGSETL